MTTIERLDAAETKLATAKTALKTSASAAERLLRHESVADAEQDVTTLRRQLDAETEAQAVRDAVEQGARKKLDTGAKQLDASTRGLAEAVELARAALESVYRKAEAHAALVERWRGQLCELGLTGETRPDGQPQNTGTGQRAVVIDGHQWIRFAPATVLAFATSRGAAPDRVLTDRLRGIAGPDEWQLVKALADVTR